MSNQAKQKSFRNIDTDIGFGLGSDSEEVRSPKFGKTPCLENTTFYPKPRLVYSDLPKEFYITNKSSTIKHNKKIGSQNETDAKAEKPISFKVNEDSKIPIQNKSQVKELKLKYVLNPYSQSIVGACEPEIKGHESSSQLSKHLTNTVNENSSNINTRKSISLSNSEGSSSGNRLSSMMSKKIAGSNGEKKYDNHLKRKILPGLPLGKISNDGAAKLSSDIQDKFSKTSNFNLIGLNPKCTANQNCKPDSLQLPSLNLSKIENRHSKLECAPKDTFVAVSSLKVNYYTTSFDSFIEKKGKFLHLQTGKLFIFNEITFQKDESLKRLDCSIEYWKVLCNANMHNLTAPLYGLIPLSGVESKQNQLKFYVNYFFKKSLYDQVELVEVFDKALLFSFISEGLEFLKTYHLKTKAEYGNLQPHNIYLNEQASNNSSKFLFQSNVKSTMLEGYDFNFDNEDATEMSLMQPKTKFEIRKRLQKRMMRLNNENQNKLNSPKNSNAPFHTKRQLRILDYFDLGITILYLSTGGLLTKSVDLSKYHCNHTSELCKDINAKVVCCCLFHCLEYEGNSQGNSQLIGLTKYVASEYSSNLIQLLCILLCFHKSTKSKVDKDKENLGLIPKTNFGNEDKALEKLFLDKIINYDLDPLKSQLKEQITMKQYASMITYEVNRNFVFLVQQQKLKRFENFINQIKISMTECYQTIDGHYEESNQVDKFKSSAQTTRNLKSHWLSHEVLVELSNEFGVSETVIKERLIKTICI